MEKGLEWWKGFKDVSLGTVRLKGILGVASQTTGAQYIMLWNTVPWRELEKLLKMIFCDELG